MKANTLEWQIVHASVRGKSHMDRGLPNQDALHLAVSADQTCFSLAISDGAGSAQFAEEGAKHFAHSIGDKLLALVHDVNERRLDGGSRNLIGDQILHIISTARQELDPRGTALRDYASNLMALAMGPHWGVRVHLGDAVMIKSRFEKLKDDSVDYFADTQMTAQDRSEYANETHFLTQHDWARHLVWDSIDPNGSEDMFALMTDGAGDIALSNTPNSSERRIFRGFFSPLVTQVLHADPVARNQVVHDALASPQTFRITGDDKTLALVLKRRCWPKGDAPSGIQPIAIQGSKPEIERPLATSLTSEPPETQTQAQATNIALPPLTSSDSAKVRATKAKLSRTYWGALCLTFGLAVGLLSWPVYQWGSERIGARSAAPALEAAQADEKHLPAVQAAPSGQLPPSQAVATTSSEHSPDSALSPPTSTLPASPALPELQPKGD